MPEPAHRLPVEGGSASSPTACNQGLELGDHRLRLRRRRKSVQLDTAGAPLGRTPPRKREVTVGNGSLVSRSGRRCAPDERAEVTVQLPPRAQRRVTGPGSSDPGLRLSRGHLRATAAWSASRCSVVALAAARLSSSGSKGSSQSPKSQGWARAINVQQLSARTQGQRLGRRQAQDPMCPSPRSSSRRLSDPHSLASTRVHKRGSDY